MEPAVTDRLNDQDVYQATKDIFVGEKSKFRKVGPVRKSTESYQKRHNTVRQFVDLYGAEAIYQIVLRLLSGGVCESKLIASRRFPDLFNPSVVQSAARDMLEGEAIRNKQTALEGIVQSQLTDSQGAFDWGVIRVALHGKLYLPLW
jgi:hypothetical protein